MATLLYGPQETAEVVRGHPEWVSLDEAGRRIYRWGCLAFDYANLGWQNNYMGNLSAYFAKEYDIDGWRVDCAAGGHYNWRKDKIYRASQSGLWGGLKLLEVARQKFKEVKCEALFYPEASGAPFFKSGDVVYDYPLYGQLCRLRLENTASWVNRIRRYLHHQLYIKRRRNAWLDGILTDFTADWHKFKLEIKEL